MLRMAIVPADARCCRSCSRKLGQRRSWRGCYILAATTDVIDGWLARRGQRGHAGSASCSTPLADKMLVATSLIMLVSVGRRIESFWARVSWWWSSSAASSPSPACAGSPRPHGPGDGRDLAGQARRRSCQNFAISCAALPLSRRSGLPAHEARAVTAGHRRRHCLPSGRATPTSAAFFAPICWEELGS